MNRPILFASIAALVVALPCSADPPRFVTEKEFSCKDIADAVNHYVRRGEAAATQEMIATIEADREFRPWARICCVCRILFGARGKEPLRHPRFGELAGLPRRTMPMEKWPRLPVVEAGSSFFLRSEGYRGGVPEWPSHYIGYCRERGKFRKDLVPVPNREQAVADLQLLRRSAAWKALRWNDSGPSFSYTSSEEDTHRYLKAQADRTPAE